MQLILAFAILVIIHEFGHFLFARIFGIRVEKFYIFFNPWTELFKWKHKRYWGFFGKTRKMKGCEALDVRDLEEEKAGKAKRRFWSDTEYGIGWLPLGGYCKIAGMIDESMDTKQMKEPAKDWEFRSKPAWQRLLVMVAGVLFNFLLAILIYAGIVFVTGERYVNFSEAKLGMEYSTTAHKAGFRDGDIPLLADGEPLGLPSEARIQMAQAKEVKVLRGGDTVSIAIPKSFIFDLDAESKDDNEPIKFMAYRIPTKVTQVATGEPAAKAGLNEGDIILAVDSTSTPSLTTFLKALEGKPDKEVQVTIARSNNGATDTITKAVTLNSNSKMGIGLETNPAAFYKSEEINYGLFESIPRGIEMGTERLVTYAKSMKLVFTKEGASSIGGFGSIGAIFPEKWDWIAFWNIAAFLSVALAFMNILPIPALDGGHVMFLLYEVITRRQPSEKFMERAQIVGMVLLILLLVYANGMDIVRLFK